MKSVVFRELPVHDANWSITTGRDGNIYVGVCGELTGGLSVFIVRYNPVNEKTEYLLEVSPALNEPPDNGRAPLSKIHYGMVPGSDGKLYCATHFSGPPLGDAIWRPWHTWDDHEKMASGFHIFSFDPVTEQVEDFGVMSRNEGSRAMALAEKKRLIYGVTWPRDHFYIFDLKNHKYRDLGRIGNVNPQSVWIDNEENGYTVDDLGFIVKYDVMSDRLIHLDVRVPKDPMFPSEERCVYDTVPSPDGKSIYGVVWNLEWAQFASRLFRYDFKDNKVYDLGPGYGKDPCDHIGGLIFGEDGYLYYAASRKDSNRRIPYRMYLFRMNVHTLEKEEIAPFDDGEYHAEYIAKATIDFAGNLYFADTNNRPTRIYIYTPEGASGKFIPRWPLVRSWG